MYDLINLIILFCLLLLCFLLSYVFYEYEFKTRKYTNL